MLVYESKEITRDELEKQRKRNQCAVCKSWLNMFLDNDKESPQFGKVFIACADWKRTHHDVMERKSNEPKELNIETRRENMESKHGEENTRALAKYLSSAVITRDAATEIVETLWKGAPPPEKTKAILLCAAYNLNPLMNHLFMLPFKTKDGTVWAVAIGIEATRLMAHRKHKFTYLDLTPRRATKDELEKILGDQVDPKKLYFITKIRDLESGAEVYGLGSWEGGVYGADKGNSPANMAGIRSERQALKRLYPAEMPTGVEVVDEQFVSIAKAGDIEGEYKEVDKETGEIKEAPSTAPEAPEPPAEASKEQTDTSPPPKSNIDLAWLDETLPIIKWQKLIIPWITTQKGWAIDTTGTVHEVILRLNKEQADILFKKLKELRDASGK